jgi:stage II sporulation protein D
VSAHARRHAVGRLVAGLAVVLFAGACAPKPAPKTAAPPPAPPPTATPTPGETPLPPPEPVPGEPTITVALAWDLDTLTLVPHGAALLDGPAHRDVAAGTPIGIERSGGRARVRERAENGTRELDLAPGDTLWLGCAAGAACREIAWGGRTWRGQLKVFLNPRGKLTLASRLSLETYLLGVVPAEIGQLDDGLVEAGRAQAVAARSYTLFYRGRRATEGFDLYGTVEDQVYVSIEGERPLASRVVESTSGELALYDGQPIRANYYSTCGGITADVWEAWPADPLPYLTSHRDRTAEGAGVNAGFDFCATSPYFRWREEWSASEFLGNLRRYGPTFSVHLPAGGLGRLVDVAVTSRSRSGRVWRLKVTTTTGSVVIPAYSLRQVLRRGGHPEAILRSSLFKIAVRRDPGTRRALAVVASGAGYGHGVGLCQVGALGMARAGRSADDILRFYYPGITLEKAY